MPHQAKTAPVQVPTTQSELSGLMARRAELGDQLRSVSDQRNQLVGERYSAVVNQNQGVVAEIDGRIKALSERITRLEQEKLATDDAIAAGISKVSQIEGAPILAPPSFPAPAISLPDGSLFPDGSSPTQGDREIARIGAFTLIVLALIAWRWASGRGAAARRIKELSAESQGTKDLRVAVETIAVEVERISENQRFITKLLAEKPQADPALIERGRSSGDR